MFCNSYVGVAVVNKELYEKIRIDLFVQEQKLINKQLSDMIFNITTSSAIKNLSQKFEKRK